MIGFYTEEKTTQAMIDEFYEKLSEEGKSRLSPTLQNLTESDFTLMGYVIYWINEDKFLTLNKDPSIYEFHPIQEWARRFKELNHATSIASLLAGNEGDELQVCKYISNNELSLFSTVWSTRPFNDVTGDIT